MMYRKGELSATMIDRDWPHQVALPAYRCLGHNYLTAPAMSIDPLKRSVKLMAIALVMRLCRAFDRTPSEANEAAYMRLLTPAIKYWVCKTAPPFLYEAMECLGGNGYVEEGILARHYRESPVNAIWEGSGNVMCLDVLRALSREADAALAVLRELAEETQGLAGAGEAVAFIGKAFRRPDSERVARVAVERLALLAAAAALNKVAPRSAELFAATRFATNHTGMYGAVDLANDDVRALLERALP